MCSVLIFARADVPTHVLVPRPWTRPQRGDVIDIQDDDGFDWGRDIAGPDCLGWWRVVVLAGVKRANVSGLLSADPLPDNPDVPYRTRINTIDLDGLEGGELGKQAMLRITRKRLLDAMSQKPKPENPFVIGDEKVIG